LPALGELVFNAQEQARHWEETAHQPSIRNQTPWYSKEPDFPHSVMAFLAVSLWYPSIPCSSSHPHFLLAK